MIQISHIRRNTLKTNTLRFPLRHHTTNGLTIIFPLQAALITGSTALCGKI